jgi:hypothetical protein
VRTEDLGDRRGDLALGCGPTFDACDVLGDVELEGGTRRRRARSGRDCRSKEKPHAGTGPSSWCSSGVHATGS